MQQFHSSQQNTWHPLRLSSILELFFHPQEYFDPKRSYARNWTLLLVILPYSMLLTKGRMVKQYILKFEYQENHPALILYENWIYSWGTLLGAGIVGVFFLSWVGGSFFHSRLKLCGASHVSRTDARFVFFLTTLVYSLPGVILLLFESLYFDNFKQAIAYPGVGFESCMIVFLFWSTHIQWIAVKHRFNLRGYKTFVLFYILPVIGQLMYLQQKFIYRTLKEIITGIIVLFHGL